MPDRAPDVFVESDTQFIIVSAVRYAVGRRSYAPGLTIEWVKRWWHRMTPQTKRLLARDVNEEIELQDTFGPPSTRSLGFADQDKAWREFAKWLARGGE